VSWSSEARKKFLPIRPKPLMPTRIAIICPPLGTEPYLD
jgi:hypothetical protein